MKKRKWLSSLLLYCLIAGSVQAHAASDARVEKFVYKSASGTVTFLHNKHAERNVEDCGFCHSALRTFGGSVDQLFGHNICLQCHEARNGPTQCGQCHAGHQGGVLALKSDRRR